MMDRLSTQPNSNNATSSAGGSKPSGVADQIALLRKDLSGLAHTVTGLANEQLGEAAGEVRHLAADKASDVQAAIRANPMQSAAVAAGIGFMLGLLMTR